MDHLARLVCIVRAIVRAYMVVGTSEIIEIP